MEDSNQDEQQSFQALKNKWAQQEQTPPSAPQSTPASPPPKPPKPSSIALQKTLSDEGEIRKPEDKLKNAELSPPKRVSMLTQQFEKVDVPGKPPIEKPARAAVLKKTPTPPPPPTPPIVHSPPQLEADPFSKSQDSFSSQDSDSDSDDDEEDDDDEEEDVETKSNYGEADNSLIEQVQKAHLQYTKQEESRYMGAPGVRNVSKPSNKTAKRPPPPPPPSKKYHGAVRAPPPPPTTAAPSTAPPIVKPPQHPPSAVNIPIAPHTSVEAISTSPPILPPRPMPQLPPRPSQSTLARAHTIASAPHTPLLRSSPHPPTLSDPTLNEFDNDERPSLKRSTTVAPKRAMSRSELFMTSTTYPDFSQATRNAPLNILDRPFSTGHKGSLTGLAASRNLLVTAAGLLRTWDIKRGVVTSTIMMDANSEEDNNNEKIRAVVIAPSRNPAEEGRYVWVARQDTILTVLDLHAPDKVLSKRSDVHTAPINFLLRFGNTEVWSIDQRGCLYVWDTISLEYEQSPNPLATAMPRRYEVTPHAVAATIYGTKLWMSSGRTLAVHAIPIAGSQVGRNDTMSLPSIRIPNDMGNITKLLTIPYHPYRLFASHDDGKISVWDVKTMERVQVITVSMYGICTMACVGEYQVWAGYNTGMIYVYDTRPEKWVVLKMWKAHAGAVTQLYVDETGLLLDQQEGRLQVASSDSNGSVGVWDGLLTEHWKDDHLQKMASEYCTYDDAKVMICSWNIDANKPEKINEDDRRHVREWLGTMEDPDMIVVGIQEIVDLESKKQTARSLFFKKKMDPTETEEVLVHRYKLWHDFLVQTIANNYGHNAYTVLKTDQLVGLFSCIFVRTSDMNRILVPESTSVKTGLKVMNKSIHGNKGGIAIRFVYDHTSLCFVNCHLAAGQSHVQQRNADAEGILQSAKFRDEEYAGVFTHGGDGSMIMDHEYCFLSGDLNYRIKLDRNKVLEKLTNPDKQTAWRELQEQDQLLRQKMNNPLFKLLTFDEAPIQFDPTYKYDPGTDFYDRSEKRRVPAWCDRVLYKGNGIKNLFYRRFEPRCSDHRPIAAGFSFKTKIIDHNKRDMLMVNVDEEWRGFVDRLVKDKKARYVADFEKCTLNQAFNLLDRYNWNVSLTVQDLLANSD